MRLVATSERLATMRPVFLSVPLLLFASVAGADVEKFAQPSDSRLNLVWWPKVEAPNGWHFDEQASYQNAFKAMAPDGFDFSNAETVLYAKADFKPRFPEAKTIDALIERDIADFRASDVGAIVTKEKAVSTADGNRFKVVSFVPKVKGNWEQVAYGDEGEDYILFVVSSRTHSGLSSAMPAFRALVSHYLASSPINTPHESYRDVSLR